MAIDLSQTFWINPPRQAVITDQSVVIQTEPGTDLWQRTHYGFQNDNVPALLFKTSEPSFSFSIRTDFDSKQQFDQCGLILYQDSDNWFKASIEYENEQLQRLGSVVTNGGYSDWATSDIPGSITRMHYRLSRRGRDFKIEQAQDGVDWHQMRIFHLQEATGPVNLGVYACSPKDSSFTARISELDFGDCVWMAE
jgi:regulation of enolase protein 1 (concanavalin A-like superfamily)